MQPAERYLPEQVAIDAYGNGGFRFGGLSHRGSLLALPAGMHAWPVDDASGVTPDDFGKIFADTGGIGFVLFGTGKRQVWPSIELRRHFDDVGIGLDVMDSGAAVRTYNVLLAEKRPVAAVFIAVDDPR